MFLASTSREEMPVMAKGASFGVNICESEERERERERESCN